MSRLRSPQVMLVAFLVLLAVPAWASTVVIGAAVIAVAGRLVRAGLGRRFGRGVGHESGLALGVDGGGRPVGVSERELSAHGLILGASGSGKTTALLTLLDQQIRRGRPVVAIDMKGSPAFAGALAQAAAAAGRPFKLWTPDGPGFWNPLQYGNATEGKDKLISTERFTEPHYQRAAERYVQTLLQLLRHIHPDQAPTLDEVVRLMDPKRLPSRLREVPRELADRVQDYLSGLTRDQVSAIRGLQTRLAVITEAEAGGFLKPGAGQTIDLQAALEGREVVLFSLNSSRYGQLAAQLGTLAVQDLICATGMRLEAQAQGRALPPAVIAIDEFSGIGGAHVVALFARGREAGISALVATQEMADLSRAGPGVRDQVLGSTAFKLILRQDVPESAHTVAQIAGTERVWEETRQMGGTLFGGPPGRGTRREVERFVVEPNQVKRLRTGEAILISKLGGGRPQTVRVAPAPAAPVVAPPRSDAARPKPEPARFALYMNENRPPSAPPRAAARTVVGRAGKRRPLSAPAPPRETRTRRTRRYPDPGVTR